MNGQHIFAIVLIVLGFMLFIISYFFRIMHWPDLFFGMVSGPVLFLAGTIILAIRYFKKHS